MARIAAVQLRADRGLEGNLEDAGYWLDRAAGAGAELVVLPENFAYFGNDNLAAAGATESFGAAPARNFLSKKARQLGIWLVGGTLPLFARDQQPVADLPLRKQPKPYAACLLVNPDGVEVARYHKMHLFDVSVSDENAGPDARDNGRRYRESDNYRHGGEPVVAPTPCGVVGLSVCYDLRFPELYRLLVTLGAELLVVPSAFTATTGVAHWLPLLRARAIENQCFVIGANLADRAHPKTPTWGGSVIIDPWGSIVDQLEADPGILVADMDRARLEKLRRDMPVLEHRRFEIVKAE